MHNKLNKPNGIPWERGRFGHLEYILLLLSLREADIFPFPKQTPIQDVYKNLRPISLTPILSKIAEHYMYVVRDFFDVCPAEEDRRKTVWDNTKIMYYARAWIESVNHDWYVSSDGNAASIRVVLFY